MILPLGQNWPWGIVIPRMSVRLSVRPSVRSYINDVVGLETGRGRLYGFILRCGFNLVGLSRQIAMKLRESTFHSILRGAHKYPSVSSYLSEMTDNYGFRKFPKFSSVIIYTD